MKKTILSTLLALVVMCVAAPASAFVTDWTLDLTGYGGGVHTGIDRMTVDGITDIKQYLSGPGGTLVDDDPFFVDSYLSVLRLWDTPTTFIDDPFVSVGGGTELFFYGTGLEGVATDVVAGTSFFGTDSFGYEYTSGTVGLYAGDHASIGTSTLLMSFDLASGENAAPISLVSGSFVGIPGDLAIEFLPAAIGTGIITHPLFGDIEEYIDTYPHLQAFFKFDLINNLLISTLSTGSDVDGDFFNISASSAGDGTLVLTPEPSTFLIFGLGLLGLIGFRRKFS